MSNANKDKISQIYDEISSSGFDDPNDIVTFLKKKNIEDKESNAWGLFIRSNIAIAEEDILENKEKYRELLESYKLLLEDYKKLLKELKLDNSIDIATLYSYMLWNGYFSANKKHNYDSKTNNAIKGLLFSDVILGRGVCIAYADLLKDLMNACDKRAQLVACTIKEHKASKFATYTPEIIQKEIGEEPTAKIRKTLRERIIKFIGYRTGNHAITLIDDDDKTYLFDPTTLTAQNFQGPNKTRIVDGAGGADIKYLMTALTEPLPQHNILMSKDFDERIKRRITSDEVISSFKKTTSLAKENDRLLEDAYREVTPKLNSMAKILVKEKQ